jgi:hypothetical protein
LEQAVRRKKDSGGSLAVNLVITGAMDDETLAVFFRERYRVEPTTEAEIDAVDAEVFAVIPREIVYELGVFPLALTGEEGLERLVVGIIDPTEAHVLEEASFFAGNEIVPKLLTIGQFARHYERMTGERWKVDFDTVLARRQMHRTADETGNLADPGSSWDEPIELTEPVFELLIQATALDESLNEHFDPKRAVDPEAGDLQIKMISLDEESDTQHEEIIELTCVKRRSFHALPGDIDAEERPRINRKGRGENRWVLDAAEEGEARIGLAPRAIDTGELPRVMVDASLLQPNRSGDTAPLAAATKRSAATQAQSAPQPAESTDPEADDDDFDLDAGWPTPEEVAETLSKRRREAKVTRKSNGDAPGD